MKKENKELLKRKMESEIGYKPKTALCNEVGKNDLIDIIKSGAICEVQKQQILRGGGQTMTVKFYFETKSNQDDKI